MAQISFFGRVIRPAGNVRLIKPLGIRAVDVVKVTVTVPPNPTALLICNADGTSAVTAPTAGVLTKAATASLDVSIFRPVEEVADAVTAPLATTYKSEHITVTDPAATFPFAVIMILFDTNDEEDGDAGDMMKHLSTLCETTRPAGNVRVILSPMTREVDVVKVTVALWPKPTALVIVNMGDLMQREHDPLSAGVPPAGEPMAGASSPFDNAGSALDDILKPEGVPARAPPRLSPDKVTITAVDAGTKV